PQIILLKEGTDTSQGKAQVVSNINACTAVADAVRTTLGPRGMDKLIHDDKGNTTISNDGATIMKLLDIVHPAAKILVDIAKSQDSEVTCRNPVHGIGANFYGFDGIDWSTMLTVVGDGTTTVVLLAGEFLKEAKPFIEDGVHPQNLIRNPLQYQSIVDAEWNIIYDKLDKCVKSGAKIVLSRLAIGDLATQVIPRQLCDNAGFDSTDVLNKLRQKHASAPARRRHSHVVAACGRGRFFSRAVRKIEA
ncbi:hypothetical protein BHE74_00051141, partial [Ensete ventricosum]